MYIYIYEIEHMYGKNNFEKQWGLHVNHPIQIVKFMGTFVFNLTCCWLRCVPRSAWFLLGSKGWIPEAGKWWCFNTQIYCWDIYDINWFAGCCSIVCGKPHNCFFGMQNNWHINKYKSWFCTPTILATVDFQFHCFAVWPTGVLLSR